MAVWTRGIASPELDDSGGEARRARKQRHGRNYAWPPAGQDRARTYDGTETYQQKLGHGHLSHRAGCIYLARLSQEGHGSIGKPGTRYLAIAIASDDFGRRGRATATLRRSAPCGLATARAGAGKE